MSFEMSHDSEFCPAISTCISFHQFSHIVNFWPMKNQSIGCTRFEITLLAKEHIWWLFSSPINMVHQFSFHVGLEITKITSVFIILQMNSLLVKFHCSFGTWKHVFFFLETVQLSKNSLFNFNVTKKKNPDFRYALTNEKKPSIYTKSAQFC